MGKYPTPSEPTSTDKVLVGLFVDSAPPLLQGLVSGAISTLFEAWFFEKYGDMSPDRAAEYFRNLEMISGQFCEYVADCIDNSESVSLALKRFLTNNYTSSVSETNLTTPITAEQSAGQLLPAGYTCDDEHLSGMAGWVRDQLHDTTLELMQQLEAITNPFEGLMVFVDNVEVVSWIGSLAEFFSWVQDNIVDTYEASYTQQVQDDIFCALWCAFSEECKVSVDNIIAAYVGIFTDLSITPPTSDDFQDYIDWYLGLSSLPAMAVVAGAHFLALQALRFQSSFARISGLRSLEQMIALGADETSTDYLLCDPCNLQPFTGSFDWVTYAPTDYEGITYTPIWGNHIVGEGMGNLSNPDGSGALWYGIQYEITLPANQTVYSVTIGHNLGATSASRQMTAYNESGGVVRQISSNTNLFLQDWTVSEGQGWNNVRKIRMRIKFYNRSDVRGISMTIA